MKRIFKSIAKSMWKGTHPFRRPLSRKFHSVINDHRRSAVDEIDQRVARPFQMTLERLGSIEARSQLTESIVLERLGAIEARSQFAESIVQELNLVLDGMVRELTRLQNQIEILHHKIDEQSADATLLRYGAVDEAVECVPYPAGNGERPLAVGPENHWDRKSG